MVNRILLAEDDSRLAELIRRGLEAQAYAVEVAYDGQLAERRLLQGGIDLLITDIMLPRQDGISLCRKLKAHQPGLPILMLTALGSTDDKVEGFEAGADDYLVKPFEMRELLMRVRALLRRTEGKNTVEEVLVYDELQLNLRTKSCRRAGRELNLTPKEFQLLSYFMQHPERVLPRTEIAAQVWETHFDTGTNFIDVYINYLRKKIDKDFGHKLLHTRPGMGFYLKKEA
jgi:DNA-binding response OmpR family regulator